MAQIKVYKLYGTWTANTEAIASYDVQEDGEICSMYGHLIITGADALNDAAALELSFASVSGFIANDTRASVFGMRTTQGFLTTGGGPCQQNGFVTFAPNGIPVSAGERMYLHGIVGGTIVAIASLWVYHCLSRGDSPRAAVGRRVR
jgi:hypothetical protein